MQSTLNNLEREKAQLEEQAASAAGPSKSAFLDLTKKVAQLDEQVGEPEPVL
jgi:hypothetical protein